MTAPTQTAKSLFAEFAVRLFALGIDFFAAIFIATALKDHVLVPSGLRIADNNPVVVAVAFLYFVASWVSPLRATPAQLLFGMRVVSLTGETLTLGRAVVRAAALAGLIAAAFLIFEAPPDPLLLAVSLVAYALVFLAAVMPNRQAAVNGLKTVVAVYHEELSEWPDNEIELGAPTREDYPDGGYYELEKNGVIRIRFTVIPDLVKGTIVASPKMGEGGVTWECHSEGDIARNHLPAACRDPRIR